MYQQIIYTIQNHFEQPRFHGQLSVSCVSSLVTQKYIQQLS